MDVSESYQVLELSPGSSMEEVQGISQAKD